MTRSTTILTVRHRDQVVLAGDGQVSLGETIVKSGARKVRRMHKGKVLAGFAGASADAMTLFDRLEGKLDQYKGNLTRAAVELPVHTNQQVCVLLCWWHIWPATRTNPGSRS